jgi:ribonuclease P protein component
MYRLRRSGDFRRVYAFRHSVADQVLVVYGCPNNMQFSRLGLSVSRRFGGAVRRNRWKRLVRDAFRRHREQMPHGLDFVVVPRRHIDVALSVVEMSLTQLIRRVDTRIKTECQS